MLSLLILHRYLLEVPETFHTILEFEFINQEKLSEILHVQYYLQECASCRAYLSLSPHLFTQDREKKKKGLGKHRQTSI